MHDFVHQLSILLKANADPKRAVGAKAYMKNQFEFFGMPMQERRRICKAVIAQHRQLDQLTIIGLVKDLWQKPEREYQYCAIELMAANQKSWSVETIELFEYCIGHKSWWDTVDTLAGYCTGPYFHKFPDETKRVTTTWNTSGNIWLQRSSLLFQLKYKHETDERLLSAYILHLAHSKEFFIKKAIGWVLREYAKTNPAWVINFVQQHTLSPLSKREATKHLSS